MLPERNNFQPFLPMGSFLNNTDFNMLETQVVQLGVPKDKESGFDVTVELTMEPMLTTAFEFDQKNGLLKIDQNMLQATGLNFTLKMMLEDGNKVDPRYAYYQFDFW
jgi:hypothetical protein